ncbi:DHHA1 domain-containing protein [Desulfonatronum thiosulfatophilum]|uniref:DHHA1 domain-containing protein n=1 Tax=Desulfonatronum thiosulfatophilum TaxID=617002 RepID=A0A1G6B9A8_9BACT|nr:DHH family phosphoesterase [Desulfonatronum thiosulfatophilum]SDB17191.1 DHHA1 domain-containing protein [Desulfonatronum thiosulfatophilum]
MGYFRSLEAKLEVLSGLWRKSDRWLIMMNADPDALASAQALRRIMARKVAAVDCAQVNEISRPDNLTMIKSLRIPTQRLTPNLAVQYDRFALVDSQPHHHPAFREHAFSVVIDHHPLVPDNPVEAEFKDIQPGYGATSTMLTEYLYNLKIRPGELLATALLYGIKTDTQSFERQFSDIDVRAFRYLSKFGNHNLLRKITRSEFRLDWLKYFSLAFRKLRVSGHCLHVFMGRLDSPDILVILGDFFLRLYGISWTVTCGICDSTLILIFRGDGLHRDMGKLAAKLFGDVGSAGGHATMARAEIPLENIGDQEPEDFILHRLCPSKVRPLAVPVQS